MMPTTTMPTTPTMTPTSMVRDSLSIATVAINRSEDERGLHALSDALGALHPLERAALADRAITKRRQDFVAGRQAAHAAIAGLMGADAASRVAVVRSSGGPDLGRPCVVDLTRADTREVPGVFVSISHAESIAIAVAAQRRVGVDVTPVEARGEAFALEAFAPGELEGWRRFDAGSDESHDATVARAFSAKEAVLKWRGVGFGASLQACTTRPRASEEDGERRGDGLQPCALQVRIADELSVLDAWLGHVQSCVLCIVIGRSPRVRDDCS